MKTLSVICGALLLCTSISAGASGALAVAQSTTGNGFAFGINSNYPNVETAMNAALARCEREKLNYGVDGQCAVVTWWTNRCGAIAQSPNNVYCWAHRATSSEASSGAVEHCQDNNCQVSSVQCDGTAR